MATTEQLNAIRTTARHTMTDNANAETMSSFMSVANERMDNFANVIRQQETMTQNVYNTVSQLEQDVTILSALVSSAIDNMTNYVTIPNETDDIRIATEDLAHGQLSPVLLPPQIIKFALMDIHNVIRRHAPPHIHPVLGQTVAEYY